MRFGDLMLKRRESRKEVTYTYFQIIINIVLLDYDYLDR